MKILVVDDDSSLRHMLELTLGIDRRVTEVRSADSPDSATEVAREMQPDVIIVDSSFPLPSGDPAGERLRAELPNARLISFSGIERKAPWADAHVVKSGEALISLKELIFGDEPEVGAPVPTGDPALRRFIHDIRNPIGALVGFIHVLRSRRDDLTPEQMEKVVASMDKTVARLSQIVDDFSAKSGK